MTSLILCELLAEELAEEGHQVTCAADGAQALSMSAEGNYDVVLTDVRLPEDRRPHAAATDQRAGAIDGRDRHDRAR